MFLSKGIVKVIDWIAVVILVSAAVFVTVLRVSLPSLDKHKDTILPYLNQQIGVELNIEHIHATWRDFGPVLIAKGVSIQDNLAYQLGKLDNVEFQFNFWDSLWQGRLFFKKILVSGAHLDLTHTGETSSSDEFTLETLEDIVSQVFGTQQGFLAFSDVSLKLKATKDKIVRLYLDNITWRNIKSTHRLQGQIHLDVDKKELRLKGDVLVYLGEHKDWGVETLSAAFESDNKGWHPFSVKYLRKKYLNTLNIDHLFLEDFYPVIGTLLVDLKKKGLGKNGLKGELDDFRIAWGRELETPYFSFDVKDIEIKNTPQFPQFRHLFLSVSGTQNAGKVKAEITDKTRFSSRYFPHDFELFPSLLDLNWYRQDKSYKIWSDNFKLNSSHLDLDTQFSLDISDEGYPFLSAYSALSLKDATHLIDYFPENSIGAGARHFIRNGFGSGHSENARVIWYGNLDLFPFSHQEGIFQANTDLKDVRLIFSDKWPAIEKLDANFEMRNQDIFIQSSNATSMGVKGKHITAKIPHILSSTWLELSGDLEVGNGSEAQKYLLDSPLRDSVAPALDAVQIGKTLGINLNLNIPFSNDNYRAWGYVDLNNNPLHLSVPALDFSHTSGRLFYNNEKISVKGLTARLYNQPVSVNLKGNQRKKNYHIDIDAKGNWDITTLNKSLDLNALNYLKGKSRWDLGVGLDITRDDVLFSVKGKADSGKIKSKLPYPLDLLATNRKGIAQPIEVALSGNGRAFSMDVTSPKITYLAKYRAKKEDLTITSSVLTLGRDVSAVKQRAGHHSIQVAADSADGDLWLPIVFDIIEPKPDTPNRVKGLPVGTPELIRLDIKNLKLGGLHWYQSKIDAWRKKDLWSLDVVSNEAVGKVEIYDRRPWLAHFKKLFVFYPTADLQKSSDPSLKSVPKLESAMATDFDKELYRLMPDFTLKADDFWFQGFSLGKVAGNVRRIGNAITWDNVSVKAGSIDGKSHGKWSIENGKNLTHEYLTLKAKDNSEILDRLGIDGGLRGASVDFALDMNWQGTLWGIKRDTLEGDTSLSMGEGVVKSISGSTNLVGLLSLDSLLRRIRLDFSGIFEEGLAVEKVKAHAIMKDGILTTTDSKVDTVPGDMKITGTMNFIREELDLKVNFIPDFASGVPVITAFAISPPAGVLVFAVSKVLSPVLDVVTEINYGVTGSFYSPEVNELSRNSGEIKMPESQEEK